MVKKNYKRQAAQYIPPEMMNYALCSTCLSVVLDQNEEVNELFDDLIECFRLPGYQMMMEEAKNIVPDTGTIFKELTEKSGFDIENPPMKGDIGILYVRDLIIGGSDLVTEYADKIFHFAR